MTTPFRPFPPALHLLVLLSTAGCIADANVDSGPDMMTARTSDTRPVARPKTDESTIKPKTNEPKADAPVMDAAKPQTAPNGKTDGSESKPSPASTDVPLGATVEVREEAFDDGRPKQRAEGYVDEAGDFIAHGLVTKWYEQGGVHSKVEWRHGLPNGKYETWYYHGQLWVTGSFADGRENGNWVKHHQNGQKHSEWTMDRGAWHGVYTEWHENGKKRLEVEWVHGLRQGPQHMYDEQGVLTITSDFVDGVEQP
jgi:antitoxin component YwqK of YwqJK toxin-antitoxin module